ncbi:hypothetical protein ACP275_13G155000 [Erythranthe tilingii]
MAVKFLNEEVSELCLGKPKVAWVAATATISDALTALRKSGDTHISVWACGGNGGCACVGKFCMADVILFLCREENSADPFKAFESPVSDILPKGSAIVRHIESNYSLVEAIDYILDGTQNLVIPIQNHNPRKKFLNNARHVSHEYCWLTQENVIRFLLNSVGVFSPIPTFTIESLNVIDNDIMTILYSKPAISALAHLNRALTEQTSVAIVDEHNRLIGEISPLTLACCDETAAAAIKTLSAVDLMTYMDCGGPQEDLAQLVKTRLEERNLGAMVEMMDEFFQFSMPLNSSASSSSSCSCSSDDESVSVSSGRNWWWSSRGSGSGGRHFPARRSKAIVCNRGSSLVAVMVQALAHRVTCVWVVEKDGSLVGAVTFAGILNVFRSATAERHHHNNNNNNNNNNNRTRD